MGRDFSFVISKNKNFDDSRPEDLGPYQCISRKNYVLSKFDYNVYSFNDIRASLQELLMIDIGGEGSAYDSNKDVKETIYVLSYIYKEMGHDEFVQIHYS